MVLKKKVLNVIGFSLVSHLHEESFGSAHL